MGEDREQSISREQSRAQTPSSWDLGQASPTLSLKIFLGKMKIIMPIIQGHGDLVHRRLTDGELLFLLSGRGSLGACGGHSHT